MVRMQNVLLMGNAKQRVFYMKAFSCHGYKHSVVEWFTIKSRVTLENTLKELNKATEAKCGFTKKTIFHILSAVIIKYMVRRSLPLLSAMKLKRPQLKLTTKSILAVSLFIPCYRTLCKGRMSV